MSLQRSRSALMFVLAVIGSGPLGAQDPEPQTPDPLPTGNWREIGPAVFGGRVVDVALYPGDRSSMLVASGRSEEHTSELQSRRKLVCRLLLEKKKIKTKKDRKSTCPSWLRKR